MQLPDGLYRDKRLKLQLESSSCGLEEHLPHPDGNFTITAHERGFRIASAYHEAGFSSVLPYDAIERAEALMKFQVKRRPDFSVGICVLLFLVFILFLETALALILALMATAILGMFMQAETVFRRLRIRFREGDGLLHEITIRYPRHKTEEVHSYFVRFIPEKFSDPLAGR